MTLETQQTLLVNSQPFRWVPGAVLTIGRGEACDVVVDDVRVSRVHARLEAGPRGWTVVDAKSRNGTFLGDERVETLAVSNTPLVIRLGSPGDGPAVELFLAPSAAGPLHREVEPGPAVAGDAGKADEPALAARAGDEPDEPDRLDARGARGGLGGSSLGRLVPVRQPRAELFRVGRAPDNDLVLADDPRASRHHAELQRVSTGEVRLRDLSSHNGTFVNGERVHHASLADGDIISIGNHVFRFERGRLEEYSEAEEASLSVAGLSVEVGGAKLLSAISFSLSQRSLLAIVGPSGTGKTTLVRALTGFLRPSEGSVTFAGRDLYDHYEELRGRVGYVPQDDLVHPQLTARMELQFAAALRLPPDLGADGLRARAAAVLDELGLGQHADLQIERLSGGQRKRASVGIELLTAPALLYLDEPTSGLDPGNEQQVMSVLRRLADGRRIVVVVTHATQSLEVADRVFFLARGGHLAYYGPPSAALAFFERHGVSGGYAAIFRALETDDGARWAARFRRDGDYARYVGHLNPPRSTSTVHVSTRLRSPVSGSRQTAVLSRRQLRILAGDRRTLLLLAAQAPAFAVILTLLFPAHTFSTLRGPFAALLEWLLIVSSTWLGASNTVREIVKEQTIYRRERAAGLSVAAFATSKALVFGCITVLQSAVLLAIVLARQRLPAVDPYAILPFLRRNWPGQLSGLRPFSEGSVIHSQAIEVFVAVALAGLAGMALGLLISTLVRRSDQAVFLLPVVLIVEMALSLPILQLQNPSALLLGLGYLTSANWGMGAIASSTSLNQLMTSYQMSLSAGDSEIRYYLGHPYPKSYLGQELRHAITGNPSWAHTPGRYALAICVLAAMVAVLLGALVWALRRLDVGAGRKPFQQLEPAGGACLVPPAVKLSAAGPAADGAHPGEGPPPR